jgi:hypothetical protein
MPYSPSFMYVNIVKRITNLIFAPQKEWQAIGNENSDQTEVLTKFVLPLIGIGAGFVFIRQLWLPDFSLTKALRMASLAFGVMMLGIYSVYWMNQKLFGKKLSAIEPHHWFAFAAYASGIYCLAETVAMAFPVLGFARIGALLSAFTAYQWGKSANMANVGNRIVIAIVTAAALMASGIIGSYIANWL